MRWDAHVDALCAKVASRLYSLKILKRSGLQQKDLLCFYCCVLWHHNLTTAQSDRLEALQKVLYMHHFAPIATIQYFQQKFFKQIYQPEPGNCLHDLIPSVCDNSVSLQLRHSTICPIPFPQVRTKRYCSFINYSSKYYHYTSDNSLCS